MWKTVAVIALSIVLVCPAAWAQEDTAEAPEPGSFVWYVIRPGDTIEGLTIRYLGSRDRWQENAKLNEIEFPNPHVIQPGKHVRLLVPTQMPANGAMLREISNKVEDNPAPFDDWNPALKHELLRARDGLRTDKQSSAELEFPDKTALLVTEESFVIIGDEDAPQVQVDRTQIEIVVGQADLQGSAAGAQDANQFEIVLGDAKATPSAGEDGPLQTRARLQDGGAQLMVYSGESELEAGGAKVSVGTGMGSSVPEGEPPKPPEKLLPAPADLVPAPGSGLATPRPAFSWAAVDGADSYTLEVCRDPRCGSLLERVTELTEASWQPAGLPVEKLYWRVTAVSASGLDGYPADSVDFEILSAVEDTAPPEVRIGFTGPQLAPRSGLNDRWIVGPGMTIEVEVEDAGSGVGEWTPAIDGQEIAREALKGPWQRGEHTVTVAASDRAGNRREVEVPFTFDPDPPEFSWGVEGGAELGNTAGEPSDDSAHLSQPRRGRREMKIGKRTWQLDSDMAEVLVRPQSGKPVGLQGRAGGARTEQGGAIGRDHGLWVLAQDAVCSELDNLSYELVPGDKKGEFLLRVEAVDCVGNTRRGQLPLVKQKKR